MHVINMPCSMCDACWQRAKEARFYLGYDEERSRSRSVCKGNCHCSPFLALASSCANGFLVFFSLRLCFLITHQVIMEYYNYYDFFVAFLIPLTLIISLNSVTAGTVWKLARVRRTMTTHKRYDFSWYILHICHL